MRFESGRALLIHLRMTGSLRHWPAGEPSGLPADPHRRAVVRLDDGSDVAYRDVRRFGTWLLLEPGEVAAYIDARVGPEPLAASFRARDLGARLAQRRAPVKAAILDQRTLAGVGNIYADEALWRARIHPLREARSLDGREVQALYRGIRRALQHGIARQGSTLRDYALPDGGSGEMQHEFRVYGRAGLSRATAAGRRSRRSASPAAARGTARCASTLPPSAWRQPRPRAARRARRRARGGGAPCSRRSAGRRSRSAGRSSYP